ncbi:DUF2326 domain-containing protein [Opitutus terrae]|uniref:DUF2326 domain-containing protein n=1 Tax=Opitutus terrae (strain DSM 11246 / JCM 15787 / PB90-1) TaxID=452637 RepID=B1ZRI5_OPITP|nr:DUF2326 domain-containing protein [Opitutus terrae]ACB77635.1 conserved hypothetical protein [Opitutus terrae PB90-1]
MFLKALIISRGDGHVVRDVQFHAGLNLIVDETPAGGGRETGNSVGKTTVLKLIDFCLGGDPREIYSDPENKQNEYKLVRDFLVSERVLITLLLVDSLADPSARVVRIERNFLHRRAKIQRVDGQDLTDADFEKALTDLLIPGHYGRKPTFRQIISHNIRYKDESVSNVLRTLDRYSRADEYETLHLFLLGCDFSRGEEKQTVRAKIELEEKFRRRLESQQTKSGYEALLAQVDADIKRSEARRAALDLNPNFEADMERLNGVRYLINVSSSEIGRLELRRDLITETKKEMATEESKIDVIQLRQFYEQATSLVGGIQKKFEELQDFHNKMLAAKTRFIAEELPQLTAKLATERMRLSQLVAEEKALAAAVTKTDSFAVLERLVAEQNLLFQQKGDYEKTIQQIETVENTLEGLNRELMEIDTELFSDAFGTQLKEKLSKFNRYFATVSDDLYGERYALKADTKTVKGRRVYEFQSFNTNYSSGKKQGEISCFDIAYTLFADDEGIPVFHFLLNDKKELMHDNQLVKIAHLVNARGIQFVASILQDKLPDELKDGRNIVLRLSQSDKLFRI